VSALATLPDETVIDGEVVALDDSGWPSFSALQDYVSSKVPIVYYVFDVLMVAGRNVMSEPASVRRDLLRREILPKLGEPIRESPVMGASLPDLINAVRAHGFEGLWRSAWTANTNRASARVPGARCGSAQGK